MAKWLEHWLFYAYRVDARSLAVIRMVYVGYTLLFLGQRVDWVADLPASALHPAPGLASWLPLPFPKMGIFLLSGLLLMALVAVGIGFRTRWASRMLGGLLLLLFAINQGTGKIDHVLLLAIFPFLMSWSGWETVWSSDARAGKVGRVEAWPLSLLALTIGFLWFTAGYFKWQGGWLDADTCAACWHFAQNQYGNEREVWLSFPMHGEWLDWATVLFEAAFLPAVLVVRAFRTWIWAALGFHLGVQLAMGIDFSSFGLVYLPFLAWEVVPWRGKPSVSGPHPAWGLVLVVALAWGLGSTGSLFHWAFGPAEYLRGVLTLGILFAFAGSLLLISFFRKGRTA